LGRARQAFVRPLQLLLLCAVLDTGSSMAQPDGTEVDPPATRHAQLQPGVEAKIELVGGSGWQEEFVYELFFVTDESELVVDVPQADGRVNIVSVYRVARADMSATLRVEKCRLVDGIPRCQVVAGVKERLPRSGKLVELTIPPQRFDWDVDFFRLSTGEGRYVLTPTNAAGDTVRGTPRESPGINRRTLPTLADLERQYAEQRPFLRLLFSPLVRDQSEGGSAFNELAASFDGGMYRASPSGNRMWQLTWEGDVATRKGLAFDRMAMETGLGVNLRKRDWMPATFTVGVEADRDLDALDFSGVLSVRHILPFNIAVQSGRYRPALAPRVQMMAAAGYAARREAALGREEPFFRSGYDLRWRVPVAQASAFRIHHAGTWNTMSGVLPDLHLLWDLLFETELGGVTYFVGYQKGEAAPLFQPTETTRIGFSLATAGLRRK
jgi:hypothetical protein